MKNKRVINYDLLRVVAMIGVVLIHINGYFLYYTDVNIINFDILNSYTAIVRFSALTFIMISGAFLLDPNKKLDTKTIYKKYVLRTFLALVIFNTIYTVYYYYFVYNFTGFGWIKMSIIKLISGDIAGVQFWYLYAAIWLYMLTPLFRIITKNASKRQIEYLLIIGFIFTIFWPTLTSYWKFKILAFDKRVAHMNVTMGIGYSLYYFAGYYINHYWNEKYKKYNKYVYLLGFISLIFTIFIGSFVSKHYGQVTLQRGFHYFSINVFLYTISIFLLFKNLKLDKINDKIKKIISYLSSRSFGVYLTHTLFIALFVEKLPNINSIILVPLFTIIITIISLIVTELLGLIPFFRKKILMY